MVIYIVDDEINIVDNSKVINKKLENIIDRGRIKNRLKFINEFINICKQAKIKNKLLGENIRIIKNSFYNESDLFYLENIFNELGYNKVIFKNIEDYFLNKEATYIEFNKQYLVINLREVIFWDGKYFDDLALIFRILAKDIKKQVIFFGNNKLIEKVKINGKNVYYMSDYQHYLVKRILEENK